MKEENSIKNLAVGKMLIAGPPFFSSKNIDYSTIIITEHNPVKSKIRGLIFNYPTERKLGDYPEFRDFWNYNIPVFAGGLDVNDGVLYFLHSYKEPFGNENKILPNLYLGQTEDDFEIIFGMILENLIDLRRIRFFVGNCKWYYDELEQELRNQAWYVDDTDAKTVMTADHSTWEESLRKKLKFSSVFENISTNFSRN